MPKAPHDVDLYTIGKGRLYIAEWSSGSAPTDPDDYEDVGNCPSFEVEPVVERLDHYSSRSGARTKDKSPIIETKVSVTFDLDEIAGKNIKRFFACTKSGSEYRILQDTDKEYALKFIADNPVGPGYTVRVWKVTLNPNGSAAFISDEWMVLSFTGEGLADTANHSNSPFGTITWTTTSTTTTSSSTTSTTTAP